MAAAAVVVPRLPPPCPAPAPTSKNTVTRSLSINSKGAIKFYVHKWSSLHYKWWCQQPCVLPTRPKFLLNTFSTASFVFEPLLSSSVWNRRRAKMGGSMDWARRPPATHCADRMDNPVGHSTGHGFHHVRGEKCTITNWALAKCNIEHLILQSSVSSTIKPHGQEESIPQGNKDDVELRPHWKLVGKARVSWRCCRLGHLRKCSAAPDAQSAPRQESPPLLHDLHRCTS